MLRSVAVVFFVWLGCAGWAGAASAQQLSIDIVSAQPRVDRFDKYTTAEPILIRVNAPQAQRVTIVGTAPDGRSVRIPLAKAAGGVYAGSLTAATPGTWSLAADTIITGSETMTETFPVVVAQAPSNGDATLFVALSAASICGGLGLIAIGRAAGSRSVG